MHFLNHYSLTNIKEPTCFKNVNNPSLVHVILTNSSQKIASHLNVSIGVSDHHNFICAATRMFAPTNIKRNITYRFHKKVKTEFTGALDMGPFDVCKVITLWLDVRSQKLEFVYEFDLFSIQVNLSFSVLSTLILINIYY